MVRHGRTLPLARMMRYDCIHYAQVSTLQQWCIALLLPLPNQSTISCSFTRSLERLAILPSVISTV